MQVSLSDFTKSFDGTPVIEDLNLTVRSGEMMALLGPSGCGKSTTLFAVCGIHRINKGKILFADRDVSMLPSQKRNVGVVFQNYALYPHMSVFDNIAFPLSVRRMNKADIKREVEAIAGLAHIDNLLERKPGQLSGGQQQRVALARALAPEPKVLLLDEPLSALDLKLRQAVRMELKQIQRETGIAFVFVTHDQEEALTMSDRIAVMSDGHVQQIGTPREIYEAPANRFVADFIGETNLIEVPVLGIEGGMAEVSLPGGRALRCPTPLTGPVGQGVLSLRPERIDLCAPGEADLVVTATDQVYLGTDIQLKATLTGGQELTIRLQNALATRLPEAGTQVGLKLEAGAARLLAA